MSKRKHPTPDDIVAHMNEVYAHAKKVGLSEAAARSTAIASAYGRIPRTRQKKPIKPLTHCQAGQDGECNDKLCPQLRDKEPETSNRFCPLPSCGIVALRERGE